MSTAYEEIAGSQVPAKAQTGRRHSWRVVSHTFHESEHVCCRCGCRKRTVKQRDSRPKVSYTDALGLYVTGPAPACPGSRQ